MGLSHPRVCSTPGWAREEALEAMAGASGLRSERCLWHPSPSSCWGAPHARGAGTCPVSPGGARRRLEPRAPACMGESGDFQTQRLKLSNFSQIFLSAQHLQLFTNQSPLHLWCAFRAAMNFKMCKNDRILKKALIFLFIFMHFIN